MRNFLLCTICASYLLTGCEETEGTQIGNEGLTQPPPTTPACDAKALEPSTQFDAWPGTLDEVVSALITKTIPVTLEANGSLYTGEMQVEAAGYRIGDDGDCDHVSVGVTATVDLGDSLTTIATGKLYIPAALPTGAEGELMAQDWTGDLLAPPGADRALLFDTVVGPTGFEAEVVLETCPTESDCTEDVVGVITSDPT